METKEPKKETIPSINPLEFLGGPFGAGLVLGFFLGLLL